MRTRTKSLANRRVRRNLLGVLLVLTSPVYADQPKLGPIQTMPPLPLMPTQASGTVRENPFFRSGPQATIPSVTLASTGRKAPNAGLEPIGVAIGLQSIASKRTDEKRPAMTIEVVESSGIRMNPLVRSNHRDNQEELVEAKVSDGRTPTVAMTIGDREPNDPADPGVKLLRPGKGTHQVAEPAVGNDAMPPALAPPVIVEERKPPKVATATSLVPSVSRSQPSAATSQAAASPALPVATPTQTGGEVDVATAPEDASVESAVQGSRREDLKPGLDREAQNQPAATNDSTPIEFALSDSTSRGAQGLEAPVATTRPTQPSNEANDTNEASKAKDVAVTQPATVADPSKLANTDAAEPSAVERSLTDLASDHPEAKSEPVYFSLNSLDAGDGDSKADDQVQKPIDAIADSATVPRSSIPATIEADKSDLHAAGSPDGSADASSVAAAERATQDATIAHSIIPPASRLLPVPIQPEATGQANRPAVVARGRARTLSVPIEPLPSEPIPTDEDATSDPTDVVASKLARPANVTRLTDATLSSDAAPGTQLSGKPIPEDASTASNALVRRPSRLIPVPITPVDLPTEPNGSEQATSDVVKPNAALVQVPVTAPSQASQRTDDGSQDVSPKVATQSPSMTPTTAQSVEPGLNLQPFVIQPPADATEFDHEGAISRRIESTAGIDVVKPKAKRNEVPSPAQNELKRSTGEAASEPMTLAKADPPALIVVEKMDPIAVGPTSESAIATAVPADVQESLTGPQRPMDGVLAPIAIKQIPAALSRGNLTPASQPNPAVHPVQALELNGQAKQAKPQFTGTFTPLSMQQGKVRSLKIGDHVAGFEVEDESVCQVLKIGANELRLVGIQSGTTRLNVTASVGEGSKSQTQGFEIRVSEMGTQLASPLEEQCERLSRSINNAFSQCQIKLTVNRDRLVVSGTCESEELGASNRADGPQGLLGPRSGPACHPVIKFRVTRH